MSRIGKKPIVLPQGVQAELQGSTIRVKGPKGELVRAFSQQMQVTLEDGQLVIKRPGDAPALRALHGTTRALLANMVQGVNTGFSKTLQIEGVGYRAEMKGEQLVMSLGYSHPVLVDPPAGVGFSVDEKTKTIVVSGIDKELVGQVAAELRQWRPPEPYKGKGLRYVGERVRRKAGKAGKVG